jgi:hypothetical protein
MTSVRYFSGKCSPSKWFHFTKQNSGQIFFYFSCHVFYAFILLLFFSLFYICFFHSSFTLFLWNFPCPFLFLSLFCLIMLLLSYTKISNVRLYYLNYMLNLILPAAQRPGVYSASNRNEYQKYKIIMFLGSKVRRVRRADNSTAICKPIV